MHTTTEVHGSRVLEVTHGQALLGDEDAAVELVGHAFSEQAEVVVVPAELVDERFFTLRTRVAGDVVRKFAAYRVRLVVVGDLTRWLDASDAFRAFAHEANRGTDIWFLTDRAELAERLRAPGRTLGPSR